ncbi:hypothetical protein [Deinococcus marmoris]|uniref:Uncharacterized protein n=1 Tax=Deinococcus marmoris TaxID=249408 RepID=A0A1U7P4R2_9DEIO|nr:hypothetical protein [Deinococcus marmoris]OLV20146.1 hypothetical protein BOO71_0000466 [Deinococcus marmoris]
MTHPDLSADTQFEDAIIASVGEEGRTVTMDTGWSLGISAGPFIPQPGQSIRLYGKGTGYPVRGIVIDGQVFLYQTEAQHMAEWQRDIDERREKDRDEYLEGRAAQEAAIALLPTPFQARLARFLKNAPDTAWAHQGYELATCQAAVAIADAVGEGVQAFRELTYEEQIKRVPLLDELGLSGNQFGMAVRLAHLSQANPSAVSESCATISPLVGCQEAGCVPGQGL